MSCAGRPSESGHLRPVTRGVKDAPSDALRILSNATGTPLHLPLPGGKRVGVRGLLAVDRTGAPSPDRLTAVDLPPPGRGEAAGAALVCAPQARYMCAPPTATESRHARPPRRDPDRPQH